MFRAHQPSRSDRSCKYMHGLVKCLFNYDLFWLLWTCLIVFFFLLFFFNVFFVPMCRYRLGCESERNRGGFATIWAGSAICTAGERCRQVGIVGSPPGREQKTGATSGLILTHEIWDGTSSSLLPTSLSLGLWCCSSEQQRLIVLDLARRRICIGAPLVYLFDTAVLF